MLRMKRYNKVLSMSLVILMLLALVGCGDVSGPSEEAIIQLEREEYEQRKAKEKAEEEITEQRTLTNGYEKLQSGDDVSLYVIGNYSFDDNNELISVEPLWVEDFKQRIDEEYGSKVNVQYFPLDFSSVAWAWLFNDYIGFEETYGGYDFMMTSLGTFDAQMMEVDEYTLFYEALVRNMLSANGNAVHFEVSDPLDVRNNHFYDETSEIADHYSSFYVDGRLAVANETSASYIASECFDIVLAHTSGVVATDVIDIEGIKPLNPKVSELTKPTIIVEATIADGFRKINNMISNTTLNSYIAYDIKKSYALLTYIASDEGGQFDVYINDELSQSVDTHIEGNRATRTIVVGSDLSGLSRIEIRPTDGVVQIYNLSTN